MREFELRMNADKFLHQNRAEVVDIVEGTLIDNLLAESEKAVIGLFETYANCWSSIFTVYYAKHGTPEVEEIYRKFEELAEREDATA